MVKYDFSGKVAVVTGSASGIGRAIAEKLAGAGCTVALCDLNLEGAREIAASITQEGGKAHAYQMDVSNETSVIQAITALRSELGGLDIAINNAGIEADTVPLADLDSDNFRKVSAVNLSSVFYCMKAEIRTFLNQSVKGVILNTASISGIIGGYNLSAYTATKHGVIGMTKAAAVDYGAKGIRINALCPGLVDTPFVAALPQPMIDRLVFSIPAGRPAQASEIANAALWLCSDDASYVTGHSMVVDGAASLGAAGTRFDDLI
ncbi:SDR family NAD(P)-dependent oxidoreductase [Novosphingobium rosa]|uniref:SDR family NAD(P)-dependent oxidoreductase n=1 Tax=Novosphingobium rosa TaxID=76978 RepID=UPI00082C2B51|nr:SDR family NAD(P)-dependent oxidoreductase [Novosphingobium rosa]